MKQKNANKTLCNDAWFAASRERACTRNFLRVIIISILTRERNIGDVVVAMNNNSIMMCPARNNNNGSLRVLIISSFLPVTAAWFIIYLLIYNSFYKSPLYSWWREVSSEISKEIRLLLLILDCIFPWYSLGAYHHSPHPPPTVLYRFRYNMLTNHQNNISSTLATFAGDITRHWLSRIKTVRLFTVIHT